jgi:hypothetical protein
MTPADHDRRAARIRGDGHRWRPDELAAYRTKLHADRRRASGLITSWWLWAVVVLTGAAALGAAAALATGRLP